MGFVTNVCRPPGLASLLCFRNRREAHASTGAVDVLGAFALASKPQV